MSSKVKKKIKPVYCGRVFEVFEEDIALPDGRIYRISRIEHSDTVAVVPLAQDGKVLLIRQYRPAVGKNLIEIPAGTMNHAEEDPNACAERELAEETGFKSGRLIKLFGGYLVPGYGNEYMHFYLALDLYPSYLPADEDESIELVPTALEDALSMIRSGGIVDSKTALGLYLADEYLRKDQKLRETEMPMEKGSAPRRRKR
jgi:ADP-ribose pyrophosphatase